MIDKTEQVFVDALLDEMDLADKVGQMTMAERAFVTPAEVTNFRLGSVFAGGGSHPDDNSVAAWVDMADAFWAASMAIDDRPAIPLVFGVDAVHGHNNVKDAVIFPHNLGLGAANDVRIVENAARVTAREVIATGLDWNFAPTLAVVQDCRWGRSYESFGADPDRVAKFGEAYVRVLQAEGLMACAKHWVGDGATEDGIDQGDTKLDWQTLNDVHISPYLPSLDLRVPSVMVSFSSWNGVRCHAHHHLVTDVLKGQLGFEGVVVSDWDGVKTLDDDFERAVLDATNAGLDMMMMPEDWQRFIETLIHLVEAGDVPLMRIDDAVRRILLTKKRLGLFDLPRPRERPRSNAASFGSTTHRELAREAVCESLVLLKNDAVLPLDPEARILVAGKNAHDLGNQCGGWTISWQGESGNGMTASTTIFEAISAVAPTAELSHDGREADPLRHDVAIVVIGETPYAESFGDIRTTTDDWVPTQTAGVDGPIGPYAETSVLADIHPEDLACIEAIARRGIPIVTILVSGRPLVADDELDASAAFIAAWLPGSEGDGVADVLFGKRDFAGRLPVPWPARNTPDGGPYLPIGFGLMTDQTIESTELTTLSD